LLGGCLRDAKPPAEKPEEQLDDAMMKWLDAPEVDAAKR
jgi:hypothetical protein